MRRLLRALVKMALNAAVIAALGAVLRHLIGRLSGEPGVAGAGTQGGRASFDAWPPVPQAPQRRPG